MAGKAGFDESGKVFTIAVTLEPDRDYELSLNFTSAEGVRLNPVPVRFRTRGK